MRLPEDRAFIPESIFHRALLNLIVNSAEATGEQGQILVKASGDDENIRIEVNDDGPGIPPEERNRVLEAFYTTNLTAPGWAF